MTRLPSHRIAGILCAVFISTLFAWSAAILPPAPVVHAATTWHVTSTDDGAANASNCQGPSCRLRDAIAAASSGDTIDFQLSFPATITLTAGALSFSTDLMIDGPTTSTLSISGNNASRVFSLGASHASINNLTIRDGNAPGNQGGGILIGSTTFLTLTNTRVVNNTAQFGGGIYSIYGTLVLTNVTVANNIATTNAGGIQNTCCIGPSSLIITNSTISGNIANGLGGGIVNGGYLTITNSSLSFNQAISTTSAGGGIYNVRGLTINDSTINGNQITIGNGGGGGIYAGSSITMTLTNVTISGNTSYPAGNGWGGGILSVDTPASLSHVTIANNSTGSGGGGGIRTTGLAQFSIKNTLIAGNISTGSPDCEAGVSIYSEDYNLIQNISGCSIIGTTTHNVTSVNPKLSALGSWGGSTQTHGLISGSPALDQIPNGTNGCGTTYTTDQRGFARPTTGGTACDIGAFEGVLNGIYLPLIMR